VCPTVFELAASDERVVAGAIVGSLAHDDGDRWSDLDLTFGVADDLPVMDVLIDWTRNLVDEIDAVHLFDLPSGATIYRVFLLPGCLQFDLSFTPASPLTCAPALPMRSFAHWIEMSCFARSAARSPGCCAKQMKFGSWLRRSNLSYTR
jgi:hypothetical protein